MLQAQHITHITVSSPKTSCMLFLNLLTHTPILSAATSNQAVSWLRQSVTCHSLHKPGFNPRLVHVGFVMEKSGSGTLSTLVLHCQYRFTNAKYSHFIHLPPTLHNISNQQHCYIKHLSLSLLQSRWHRTFPSSLTVYWTLTTISLKPHSINKITLQWLLFNITNCLRKPVTIPYCNNKDFLWDALQGIPLFSESFFWPPPPQKKTHDFSDKKISPKFIHQLIYCWFSHKIKHRESYIYICCDTFYGFLPYIGFYNKHPLCYIGFHTDEQQFTSAAQNSRNWTVPKSCQRVSIHLYLTLCNRTYSDHMTRNEPHVAKQASR
jgi:hypothetical protein